MKFSGICLIKDNVPGLTNFYMIVLGVEADGDEVHAELKTNGASISFFLHKRWKTWLHSLQGAGFGSFTIGFEVKDLDSEYERLKTMEITFLILSTSHPWDSSSFWFRDPDGNIIDFYAIQTKK